MLNLLAAEILIYLVLAFIYLSIFLICLATDHLVVFALAVILSSGIGWIVKATKPIKEMK